MPLGTEVGIGPSDILNIRFLWW